ncbi:MAG TPA: hypothetical protein PKI19_00605 [Elusimicrobiales bacterium]|nr:hypothetical protein [Elusimicrobiales bacterium]
MGKIELMIRESIGLLKKKKNISYLLLPVFLAVFALLGFKAGLETPAPLGGVNPAAGQGGPAAASAVPGRVSGVPVIRLKQPASKSGPKELIIQCEELAKNNKKEKALEACQKAVYLAESGEGGTLAERKRLGGKAGFESYKLLKALGRVEEAESALAWAAVNDPSLAGAR